MLHALFFDVTQLLLALYTNFPVQLCIFAVSSIVSRMASNSFGTHFRITTWGESHGKAIGVVIDGCPAGLCLVEQDIQTELNRRAPSVRLHTSPRKEPDVCEILSGVFEGKTTGTPISLLIWNLDAKSDAYQPLKDLYRPGHANYTYLEKYGVFDYRGGGRASARETACRVAAGAVAKQLLCLHKIHVMGYLRQVGNCSIAVTPEQNVRPVIENSPLFCPEIEVEKKMISLLEKVKAEGDSLGGVVEVVAFGVKAGLGDPIYEKIEANLAKALLSIPGSRGFEVGEGFGAAELKGSLHNDPFVVVDGIVKPARNLAGGILGGITTGLPLIVRCAFKPTSSIRKTQMTATLQGEPATLEFNEGARHDPCIAIRAVPVVEAMCSLVLADALLASRLSPAL